jgi:hypothetical protein
MVASHTKPILGLQPSNYCNKNNKSQNQLPIIMLRASSTALLASASLTHRRNMLAVGLRSSTDGPGLSDPSSEHACWGPPQQLGRPIPHFGIFLKNRSVTLAETFPKASLDSSRATIAIKTTSLRTNYPSSDLAARGLPSSTARLCLSYPPSEHACCGPRQQH